jgi:hypothetical protein
MPDEREQLVTGICELLRIQRSISFHAYFRFQKRLRKTSVSVLRQIVDEGAVVATLRKCGAIR